MNYPYPQDGIVSNTVDAKLLAMDNRSLEPIRLSW